MPTVLYVDDDPAVRMVVRRQLEHNGLQVYTAEGVREAKERIEQMPPDGLFIDIWLGDGTAFELHAWLQEHHPILSRRVVFVSGDVPASTSGRTPTALGCPVLGKPLDVPAMQWTGIAFCWSTRRTPVWAAPRAPPPDRAMPSFFTASGAVRRRQAGVAR